MTHEVKPIICPPPWSRKVVTCVLFHKRAASYGKTFSLSGELG